MIMSFSKKIILLSLFSGIAVASLISLGEKFDVLGEIGLVIVLFGAGVIYGIFTVKHIYNKFTSRRLLTCTIWLIASVLSYAVAVQVTLNSAPSNLFPEPGPFDYAIGGFFGALILALSYKLICHLQHKIFPLSKIIVSTASGTLLPLLIFLFLSEPASSIFLYTAWPTIITAIIFTQKSSNIVE